MRPCGAPRGPSPPRRRTRTRRKPPSRPRGTATHRAAGSPPWWPSRQGPPRPSRRCGAPWRGSPGGRGR
eukprot:15315748-Alexandrium_andersonii.AAC.1